MPTTKYIELKINADRLLDDFNALNEIGATVEGGVSRLALSNEDLQARAWLADQFDAAGLYVHDDDAGNLSGILPSSNPYATTILVGSHLDTVPNGGRYDSTIGVLGALECLRTIKEAGVELPYHLEAINFTDEEGNWYSLFGSRALTGTLSQHFLNDQGEDTAPFRAALFRAGIRPTEVHRAARRPETIACYLELHIEQGYRLHRSGVDVGIVTGIVGRSTYELTFYGTASHSGTTAMEDRQDALMGAADYICQAHQFVREHYGTGVFNCGNIQVLPGSFNIIPSEVRVTFECRHADRDSLADMESALIRLAQELSMDYRLSVNVKRKAHVPAAVMAEPCVSAIELACRRNAASHMRLISYAGHDAQILSAVTRTGMIFIPSVGGISHSPREFTEWEHVIKGTNVLLQTILSLNHLLPAPQAQNGSGAGI